MAELLKSNPIALRQCILYEVLGGTPVFDAWKNFCKRIGEDVMDYVDYEFWFMRFVNKQFDLEYDQSLEPKRKNIQELPVEILTEIFGKLDLKKKLLTQKVSKGFRECVQQIDPDIKEVVVRTNEREYFINYGEIGVSYKTNHNQCIISIMTSQPAEEKLHNIFEGPRFHLDTFQISGETYKNVGTRDLRNLFEHPKLQLDTLEISGNSLFHASQILPQLQLSKVNKLKVHLDNRGFGIQGSREQHYEWLKKVCKMGAEVKSFVVSCHYYRGFFIECFMNLRRFRIVFNEPLSYKQLDEIFTKIQLSTVLESFTLELRRSSKGALQHVVKRGKFTKLEGTDIWRSPKVKHENAHLEAEMFEEEIKMVVTKIRF